MEPKQIGLSRRTFLKWTAAATASIFLNVGTQPRIEAAEGEPNGLYPTFLSISGESKDPPQKSTNTFAENIPIAFLVSNSSIPPENVHMLYATRRVPEGEYIPNDNLNQSKKEFIDPGIGPENIKQHVLDTITSAYADSNGQSFYLNYVGHGFNDGGNWSTIFGRYINIENNKEVLVRLDQTDLATALARGCLARRENGKPLIPITFTLLSCYSGAIAGPASAENNQAASSSTQSSDGDVDFSNVPSSLAYQLVQALKVFGINETDQPKLSVFASTTSFTLSLGDSRNFFNHISEGLKIGQSYEELVANWVHPTFLTEEATVSVSNRVPYRKGRERTSYQTDPTLAGLLDSVTTPKYYGKVTEVTETDGSYHIKIELTNATPLTDTFGLQQGSSFSHADAVIPQKVAVPPLSIVEVDISTNPIADGKPFTTTLKLTSSTNGVPNALYADSRRINERSTREITDGKNVTIAPGVDDDIQFDIDEDTAKKLSGITWKAVYIRDGYDETRLPVTNLIIDSDGHVKYMCRMNVFEGIQGHIVFYSESGSIEATVRLIANYIDDFPNFIPQPLEPNVPQEFEITNAYDNDVFSVPLTSKYVTITPIAGAGEVEPRNLYYRLEGKNSAGHTEEIEAQHLLLPPNTSVTIQAQEITSDKTYKALSLLISTGRIGNERFDPLKYLITATPSQTIFLPMIEAASISS